MITECTEGRMGTLENTLQRSVALQGREPDVRDWAETAHEHLASVLEHLKQAQGAHTHVDRGDYRFRYALDRLHDRADSLRREMAEVAYPVYRPKGDR